MKIKNKKYPYYEHPIINNLLELLELRYNNNPYDIAFSYTENDLLFRKTYKDLYQDVILLSNYFYKNYRNHHIALSGENSYNWLITFLAIVISGNICVVLDKDYDEKTINKLMKDTDTKIIYYSNYYCEFISKLKFKTQNLEDISKLIDKGSLYKNKHIIKDIDDAAIFFTSGTTGPNKGVVLSQKSIAANIYGASSLFVPNGKVVGFLPFHHAFGFITGILMPIYYKTEVYISSSLKDLLVDFQKVDPQIIFVVPAFVESFYKQIWKKARKSKKENLLKLTINISNSLLKIGIDLRAKFFSDIKKEFGNNLEYMICGGARLDSKYIKWFRSIGINILNGYGITECSPVVSVNRNYHYRDGSVGQIVRNVEVEIIDQEICIKGPIIMNGYYKDKKSTNKVLTKGVFHTGDLGYLDNDNFLFITGRKKNIIVLSNGENISPELIENELLTKRGVSEVVVYEDNNRLVAMIFPEIDFLGDEEYFDNLIYNYNKNKPKNHQIAFVKLRTKEFIKNNSGKILRGRIMEE